MCDARGFPETQDHFRKSRKPSYTNVFHDRGGVVGVVEFETKEDLKAAIHDLDGENSGMFLQPALCMRSSWHGAGRLLACGPPS